MVNALNSVDFPALGSPTMPRVRATADKATWPTASQEILRRLDGQDLGGRRTASGLGLDEWADWERFVATQADGLPTEDPQAGQEVPPPGKTPPRTVGMV